MGDWKRSPITAVVAVILLILAIFIIVKFARPTSQQVGSTTAAERGKIVYLCPSCGYRFDVSSSDRQKALKRKGHWLECPKCKKHAYKAMQCRQCGAWIIDVVDAGKISPKQKWTYKCPKCGRPAYLRFSKKALQK